MRPPYLLDSNFFIEAHRNTYPLDVAESFWLKVQDLAKKGKFISIDKVKNEIYKNEDALKQWCTDNLQDGLFHDSTTIISSYGNIISWAVNNIQYNQVAKDEFLHADEADAWLISFAHAHKLTIVTSEVSAPQSKKRIKIPDVCLAFKIPYITPIEMFRQLGEKF